MRRIKRPSPAFVLAFVALLAALGGTAIAVTKAPKNSVYSSSIKNKQVKTPDLANSAVETKKVDKKAITSNRIKKEAVKEKKIADDAVTDSKAAFYETSAIENVSAAGSQATAPEITLLTRGPFTIYGKCFADGGGQIDGEIYIKSSEAGGIMGSDADDVDGGGPGYLGPGFPEESAELENGADAGANNADGDSGQYTAIVGSTKFSGLVAAWAKQGTPAGGDGPYGAGNRCIFQAWQLDSA